MVHDNLRSFLKVLHKEQEIVEISASVDPYLELAEIHRRVIDQEGPALLFTNVKGSGFPVVTNLFGTSRRVDLAFGPRPEEFMRRVIGAAHTLMPPTPKAVWEERDLLFNLIKVGTKKAGPSAPILGTYRGE
ncbi:MAG TPA: 4-hydroxybenzoate decarboxylase, partial [Bacilli bacterium]